MSEVVIKAENLGKKYIIGHQASAGYKTFREQMLHHAHNFYSRTKKMITGQQVTEGDELEEFWALKELSFEINKGDMILFKLQSEVGEIKTKIYLFLKY